MIKVIPIVLIILASVCEAPGQEEIPGVWRGRVESINVNTNEFTISSVSGKIAETFTGVLTEKTKAKLLDDTIKDVSISDIPTGMYVRVFFDTRKERVAGQQVRVNRVKGIIYLGRDSFDRLRAAMNLPSTTAFRLNLSDRLPQSNPLKLYVFVPAPRSAANLVKWVQKWNKEAGISYGMIELVATFEQADLSVLVNNREVALFGILEKNDVGFIPSASVFLTAPVDGVLEVLWKYEPAISSRDGSKLMSIIAKEIEKRMRLRGKP